MLGSSSGDLSLVSVLMLNILLVNPLISELIAKLLFSAIFYSNLLHLRYRFQAGTVDSKLVLPLQPNIFKLSNYRFLKSVHIQVFFRELNAKAAAFIHLFTGFFYSSFNDLIPRFLLMMVV